ncbi:heterokaryon incompatibility protein-domain-containing protein [Xylariaceae sp. FL0016]|nr:heterokaryon incompatibility protein-domain-containing protein [Xylariaceae sp. FL0016]
MTWHGAAEISELVSSRASKRPLCESCLELNLDFTYEKLLSGAYSSGGIILGKLRDDLDSSSCVLCSILLRICRETFATARDQPFGIQLRAFPLLLSHLAGQPDLRCGPNIEDIWWGDFFLAAVPSHFASYSRYENEAALNNMVAKRGLLVYHHEENRSQRLFGPRTVSPTFDSALVREWLRCCKHHHSRCRSQGPRKLFLNLIDCKARNVVRNFDTLALTNTDLDYVALSYVWGNNNDVSKVLPLVIDDAIKVTLTLGYRYLWHEQIMHMDSVYQNAALTIIAAAGPGESYGLPGGDRFNLTSTIPSHNTILESPWASRGWTYQEAVLSTRRLVFTDEQLYFECNSMSCSESSEISLGDYYSKPRPTLDRFIQPALFSLAHLESSLQLDNLASGEKATRLDHLLTFIHCAEQYSKRSLSFDNDSLNAFSGIIRRLESVKKFPIRHIWGIPFFHPDDDGLPAEMLQASYQSLMIPAFWKTSGVENNVAAKTPMASVEQADYLAFLLLGLCWRHQETSKPPRRRNSLPSWSWAGWEGAIIWPQLSRDFKIRTVTWPHIVVCSPQRHRYAAADEQEQVTAHTHFGNDPECVHLR